MIHQYVKTNSEVRAWSNAKCGKSDSDDDCQDDSRLPLLFYLFASVECIISILCIALASYFE